MSIWEKNLALSGHDALKLVNTVGDKGKSRDIDLIETWSDLLDWVEVSEIFDATEIREIRSFRSVLVQEHILKSVHLLRQAWYRLVVEQAERGSIDNDLLNRLQPSLRLALSRASCRMVDGNLAWQTVRVDENLITDRISLCIEQLLRSPDFHKIKQCGRCTWMFIDHGRGVGRKWCSMKICGNRAKAQNFRQSN